MLGNILFLCIYLIVIIGAWIFTYKLSKDNQRLEEQLFLFKRLYHDENKQIEN